MGEPNPVFEKNYAMHSINPISQETIRRIGDLMPFLEIL